MISDHTKEYQRAYREANKERLRAYDKERYFANWEKSRATRRQSYLKNREKRLAWFKDNYERNGEKIKAAQKEYTRKNAVAIREKVRLWQLANPEKVRDNKRRWQRKHYAMAEATQALRRARKAGQTVDIKAVTAIYNMVRNARLVACYWCGVSMPGKKAHVDHVIPLARGGLHCVSNLCAACPSCNRKRSSKLPSEWRVLPQLCLSL